MSKKKPLRKAGGGVSFDILGADSIEAALKHLEPKVAKKVLRKAMRPAMKPVHKAVKANAPVESGETKAAVKTRSKKRSQKSFGVEVRVGEGDYKGDQYYAAFLEYGTSRMDAQPFMRPAYESQRINAKKLALTKLEILINEEVKKANTTGK